jgi:hypothetical protein
MATTPQWPTEPRPTEPRPSEQRPGQQWPTDQWSGQQPSDQQRSGQQWSDQQQSGQELPSQQRSGPQSSSHQRSGEQQSSQQSFSQQRSGQRRGTEELVAAAEHRLRLAEELPGRLERVRGRSVNQERTVAVTTTVHGALTGLELSERALALGQAALGAEIVRLAGAANRAALIAGVGVLSQTLGDSGTAELAASVGLGELIEPDAPVLPYQPGVDPNAHRWTVIESTESTDSAAAAEPPAADSDDYALTFDFSSLRSDR